MRVRVLAAGRFPSDKLLAHCLRVDRSFKTDDDKNAFSKRIGSLCCNAGSVLLILALGVSFGMSSIRHVSKMYVSTTSVINQKNNIVFQPITALVHFKTSKAKLKVFGHYVTFEKDFILTFDLVFSTGRFFSLTNVLLYGPTCRTL